MKIYSISIIHAPKDAKPISLRAKDLSSYNYFERSSIGQFMDFFATTVVDSTEKDQRQSVQERSYTAHVYKRGGAEDLAGVIITDQEYPVRVAFSLLTNLLETFANTVPQSSFKDPRSVSLLEGYLEEYQDPRQADPIMRVQQELDETKVIMHKTIENVLKRGETLDNLVERSNELSTASKAFYKTAKKQNDCCMVM